MLDFVKLLWMAALENEREQLAHVYARMLQVPSALEDHVKAALVLEIIEAFDRHSWPTGFQLSGIEWQMQQLVQSTSESGSIDAHQRKNYIRLLMASKGRHRDVAYGLSERLQWREKRNVMEKLIAMGKRNYHAPVPANAVMDNRVLHVAVSYKHTSAYNDLGTISELQAEAIWTSVNCILHLYGEKEVRVWVDQNLHRTKFPSDRRWHEFGLLPYACLKTVFVGNGDCTLRLARFRPWLWVEMITALHAEGIHTKPGRDIAIDSEGMLEQMESYVKMKTQIHMQGWLIGLLLNVDEVMKVITGIISLWRREFLSHNDYEWTHEFELFMNWARRFVIRNVPYSEMKWNHSSDPVCGMDAVVLLRALPSIGLRASERHFVRPSIYWKPESVDGNWVLGDIIDRSLVAEIPLSQLLEFKKELVEGSQQVTMFGKVTTLESMSFRRQHNLVSLVMGKEYWHQKGDTIDTQFSSTTEGIFEAYRLNMQKVIVTLPTSFPALLIYRPFTDRIFCIRHGNYQVGNASLRPSVLSAVIEEDFELERIGTCYNSGICEHVYAFEEDGTSWFLSTNEVNVLLAACKFNVRRFRDIVKSLKTFCSYKWMKYKDRSERELVHCTRGRKIEVDEAEDLKSCCYLSGEADGDLEDELIDILRRKYKGHTFIWVERTVAEKVRVAFGGPYHRTVLVTNKIAANRELAILKETDADRLVNLESTGLVEMAIGMEPKIKLKAYGSGLNPMIQTHEDGREAEIFTVDGLFSTCDSCGITVCNVNGLTASVREESKLLHVQWLGKHTCVGQRYNDLQLTGGLRIV